MATETDIAVWLATNHKDIPCMAFEVSFTLGSWYVTGEIPVQGWGAIMVEFDIDSCHKYKGFDAQHVHFKFYKDTEHSLQAIKHLPNLISNYTKKFEEFMSKEL